MKLSICHLYADLMNTYGDDGNIISLVNRCRWRGIEVEVEQVSIGQKIDPDKYDLYFFGGGQDQQQIAVSYDLKNINGINLKLAIEKGAVLLAICGGYQLIGNYYKPSDAEKLEGVGLLNTKTVASEKRMIGNIVVDIQSDLLTKISKVYVWQPKNKLSKLVGFENHSGQTFYENGVNPLGYTIVGFGNNDKDKKEGAYNNNVFGCYMHGSLLPKNPHFADYLIYLGLKRKNEKVYLQVLDDNLEWQAHFAAIARSRQVK